MKYYNRIDEELELPLDILDTLRTFVVFVDPNWFPKQKGQMGRLWYNVRPPSDVYYWLTKAPVTSLL